MTLAQFNQLDLATAKTHLMRCCGSAAWAQAMVDARPFATVDAACHAAAHHWRALDDAERIEAFAHHPKIGESKSAGGGDERAARLAQREQSAVAQADDKVRDALANYNAQYEQKFGFIFIICARDKSPQQILAALRTRIDRPRAIEIAAAGDEQLKIAQLRLRDLLVD